MGIFRVDAAALQACITNSQTVPLKDASGRPLIIHSSDVPQNAKIGDTRTTFSVKSCFVDPTQTFAIIGRKRGDTIEAVVAEMGQMNLRQLIDSRL